MIQLDDISLSFGNQVLFDNISCSVKPDSKMGLVGRNGSGKTTLLKVIGGQQLLDSGQVRKPKAFNIAFMPQDVVLVSKKNILQESLSGYSKLGDLLEKMSQLELVISKEQADQAMLERYSVIHHQLYEMDYEKKRTEAEKILIGLGFSQDQLNKPVETLSVGWKMRLVLAKLLLQKADFYLFDEPTNHLDLFAKDWFVEFLNNAPFGFMLVSHDQYFLDNVCRDIGEISMGKLSFYTGGYDAYVRQKEAHEALLEKKYAEQQKSIKKKMETIDRFRYKASKAKMAQSMIKSLEKIDKVKLEQQQKTIRFTLPKVKSSGKIVLLAKQLAFAFDKKKIFDRVNFEILRGHKVAIVAPNGTGKSTLLNVIMEKYTSQSGSVDFGYHVNPVFFEQDQNKSLNPRNTILQEVESACHTMQEREQIRGLLGAFLFTGDDIKKKISVLSGGEKNRVAMVKILLKNGNFLILDEPTNHLDIASKDVLLGMLSQFSGTMLFVSHDRTFLNRLATHIIELTAHGACQYTGNYDEYLYQKKHLAESKNVCKQKEEQKGTKQKSVENDYELRKQIKQVEHKISRLEKKVAQLSNRFVNLSYGTTEYEKAVKEVQEHEQELKNQNERWELLVVELDKAS